MNSIQPNQQNTKTEELLFADLTYKIRGAVFAIYNALGFGHKEQVYQKALEKELKEFGIPFKREENLKVRYKNEVVGNYRPDFLIDGKVILELKSLNNLPSSLDAQLLHYLKTTGFSLGLLINFGTPKLFIKRLVWTKNQRESAVNQR